MSDKIKEALRRIRENKRKYPPKIEKDGYHVKIIGNGERLDENFKSSGTEKQ